MLFTYAHEAGISTAIEATFSGERPCRLCTMIEASTSESSAQTDQATTVEREFKLLVLNLQDGSLAGPESYQIRYPDHDAVPSNQLQDVSLPPPKS